MRIQSIYEVNTHQQHNPFYIQYAENSMIGKNTSLISFEDCLKTQFQKAKTPAKPQREKGQAYSVPDENYLPLGLSTGSVLLLRTLSYRPLSDFSKI